MSFLSPVISDSSGAILSLWCPCAGLSAHHNSCDYFISLFRAASNKNLFNSSGQISHFCLPKPTSVKFISFSLFSFLKYSALLASSNFFGHLFSFLKYSFSHLPNLCSQTSDNPTSFCVFEINKNRLKPHKDVHIFFDPVIPFLELYLEKLIINQLEKALVHKVSPPIQHYWW